MFQVSLSLFYVQVELCRRLKESVLLITTFSIAQDSAEIKIVGDRLCSKPGF